MSSSWAENVTFILVGTQSAGNLGSAARALQNMGFSHLRLAAPRTRLDESCRRMAGDAWEWVRSAPIYGSFEEAVADMQILVGTTSGRGRRLQESLHTPRQLAPLLRLQAEHQRVGILFGPERTGLQDRQLSYCHHLVRIPSRPEAPVLNLAQSVLILAYELSLQASPTPRRKTRSLLAPAREVEGLMQHMEQVLIRIGFLSSQAPEPVLRSLRRVFARAQLDSREVRIFRGILSQVDWFARHGRTLPADQIRKP